MKKYGIITLAIAFIFSLAVSAQRPTKGRQEGQRMEHKKEFKQDPKMNLSPKKRAGYLAVDMDLSESQRDKLQNLFEKQDKQRQENMEEMTKLKEQLMKKREVMMKANAAEMEKILGTDKFNEFKAKQANRSKIVKQFKFKRMENQDKPGFQGKKGQNGRALKMEIKEPEVK